MRRQVAATVIGNALEWYDFTVYGVLAVTISQLFFPVMSGATAILSTLAIFGVAYVVRPLGGLVFGHYADVIGRKSVLLLVIGSMTLGMVLLGFAPTYAMVGIAAPIILLVARMIQGFSVGGEYATGTTYLVELAPPNHRCLYGSWQFASQGAAVMLGGIVGLLVAHGLSQGALLAWGWRIPFLLGLLIGPLGFYLRRSLVETPEFLSEKKTESAAEPAPTIDAFAHFKRRMLTACCMTLGGSASFYVLYIVMPTYAIRTLHLGVQASLVAPLVGGAALLIGSPIGGILADRYGRKPLLMITMLSLAILVLPGFMWLAADPGVGRMAALEFVLSFILGCYGGTSAATGAEFFPVRVRATGLAIPYNVGVGLFGGFAPLIVTWLVETTHSPLAPAYYDLAGIIVALIAILFLPKPYEAALSGAV
jgi:MHS family proline/betaine transporter-like MFS transporter